jgi:tyrosyl-tRNA synthetase
MCRYLKVDAQFGGQDQRKIFVLAKEFLPKLGYAERIHLMNPMVPGLTGNKMSSSDPDSKIDMLDDAATVKRKIAKAFCEEGNVDNNGLLSFLRYVIFPLLELKVGPGAETIFTINRDAKFGPPIVYKNYDDVHRDFAEKKLYPADLKLGVTDALNAFMDPVREVFKTPEMLKLIADAYPKGEASENAHAAKPTNDKKDYKETLASKPVDLTRVDIRAGKILTCERHKDADNLLVSTILLGKKEEKVKADPAAAGGDKGKEAAKPEEVRIVDDIRSVVSGLAANYKPEELVGRTVVAMCNLPPRDLKGVKSAAMILCAVADGAVQVLEAEGAEPGTRVVVPDSDYAATNANDIVLPPKLKVWETVAPELTVVEGTMRYKGLQVTNI